MRQVANGVIRCISPRGRVDCGKGPLSTLRRHGASSDILGAQGNLAIT